MVPFSIKVLSSSGLACDGPGALYFAFDGPSLTPLAKNTYAQDDATCPCGTPGELRGSEQLLFPFHRCEN